MMLWILELGMLALAVYVFVTGRAKIGPWPVSGSMALVLAALLTMPLLVGVLGSLVLWLGPGSNNSIWEYLFLFSVLSLVVGVFASSSLSGEGVVVASEGTTEEKLPSLDQTSIRSDLPRRQLRADLSDVLSPPQARRKGRSVVVAALCLAGTLAFASMAAYGWQFLQKASGASQVAASDEQKQGAAGNQQPDDGQPVAEMEVVPPQTPVVKDKVEYPHPHTVSGLTFSPNGKILVTVCNDRWFRFWDVATGQVLLRVSSPGYVWGVEYSPDGRWLALHGEGLFLCDGKTGEVRGRFLQDRKTCRGVAFSADSNTLLAISRTSVEHGNYEHKLHAIDLRRLKEFPFDVNLGEYSKVVIEEVKILANDKHVYIGAHGVTRDQR
ncbi:MAG: WD40 repeat domain-containing protein, partial [Gemmataceae bacterium]